MNNKITKLLITLFTVLCFYFPFSYGFEFKYTLIFIILCIILFIFTKKIKIKINLSKKYYIITIILLTLLTRIGLVMLLNDKVFQVSDFYKALESATLNKFDGIYYQIFTHWVLYPKLLAQVFKLFGATQFVALLTNCVLNIVTAILLYVNASVILKDNKKGFYASILYIFWPSNILYSLIVTPEHCCALLVMLTLYIFLKTKDKKEFVSKSDIILTILLFVIMGVLLGISSFFKNFALVLIVAFTLYLIIDTIKTNNYDLKHILYKVVTIVIIFTSMKITTNIVYNIIENNIVKAPIVRNVAPCYLNVGFRGDGTYNTDNYLMYFDLFKNNNYDYEKANDLILKDLKEYIITEKGIGGVIDLLNGKAKIVYGGDYAKISFVQESINDNNVNQFISKYVIPLNNFYFAVLVFLCILGLLKMNLKQDMNLFLVYLIFFGSMLLLLLVEAQNRYMYVMQTMMCIGAIAGKDLLSKIFNNQKKIKEIVEDCE